MKDLAIRGVRFVVVMGLLYVTLQLVLGVVIIGGGAWIGHARYESAQKAEKDARVFWESRGHRIPDGVPPSKYNPNCPIVPMGC